MYPLEHIWTIVMLEIFKHTFYAYLSRIWKKVQFTGFNPESFCDKNLAIRKVFAFSDSDESKHSMPWVCCAFANVIYCNLGARFAVLMTMWTVSFSLKKITDFQDFPNQLVISPACWDSTAYQDIQAWAPQDSQKPSWPRWEPWSDYDDNHILANENTINTRTLMWQW